MSIVGTSATRESFLNHVVAGVFDASTSADVLEQVKQAANKLQRHDIFEEIKVYMTASGADAVNVTFDLKEKGKGVLETTLGVGENEANVVSFDILQYGKGDVLNMMCIEWHNCIEKHLWWC